MNISMYDDIYEVLKRNISDYFSDKYNNIKVVQKMPNNVTKYPIIVFTESNNINDSLTTRGEERTDILSYDVEIYSTDLPYDGEMISSKDIVREISQKVDEVLSYKLRMRRRSSSPTPNLDTTIYRYLMQYSVGLNINRNILI